MLPVMNTTPNKNRLLKHNSIYESQNPYSACKKLHRKGYIYVFYYMVVKKRKNNL